MKKSRLIMLAVFSILFESCSLSKTGLKQFEEKNDPIQIAIQDFSSNCKLYKKGTAFSVGLYNLKDYKDLVVVRIGKNQRKMFLKSDVTVGSKGKFPSSYFEKDGKLFFWRDDDCALSQDVLTVFQRYDLLEKEKNYEDEILLINTDDSQKAAHYYFCKDNFTKYKRIITIIGMGYYTPPDLKCDIVR